MSNLACAVFEGRTGPDARSTLYNRCNTAVRLNYCLQYKNGADTCLPMTIGWEATLWDLSPGQSLVMPATNILKRWSVFACQAPLTPWQAVFQDGNLRGDCVETGLFPPRGAPAPRPTIRSNDPSTWPAGTINLTCVNLAPVLTNYFQMQLVNRCALPVNVVYCATTNVPVSTWQCMTTVPDHIGPPTYPGHAVYLPRPSQIVRWSAFACEDPAVPRNVRYDGTRLVGDCVGPPEVNPEVNVAAALPRRGGNKATARLSAETSVEDLAARTRQRSANSQAIDSERSRIGADSNNMLGMLGDVALQTAQTYAAVEAQQQHMVVPNLAQQQAMASAATGYLPPAASAGSSGAVTKADATTCVSYSYRPNPQMYRNGQKIGYAPDHIYRNTCGFAIQAVFCPDECQPTGSREKPGDERAFNSRQSVSAYRWVEQ